MTGGTKIAVQVLAMTSPLPQDASSGSALLAALTTEATSASACESSWVAAEVESGSTVNDVPTTSAQAVVEVALADSVDAPGRLCIGTRVRLRGFQSRPDLSGAIGNIISCDSGKQRWGIVLDGGTKTYGSKHL